MTDGTPRRSDALRNRERILDAAAAVFSRDSKATLNDVAAESGLARATVYRHFSDADAAKQALIEEISEEGRASLDEHFFDPGLSKGRPAQSTADILGAYLRQAFRMKTRYGRVMAGEPEPGAGLIEAFLPITEAMIRQGQARFEFRADVDVRLAAETYLSLTIYAARRAGRDGVPIDDAVGMVETFLRGLEISPGPVRPPDEG